MKAMENSGYTDSITSISTSISIKEKLESSSNSDQNEVPSKEETSSSTSQNNEIHTKMTFLLALVNFMKDISIEPMLFVKNTAYYIYRNVIEQFKLERFCILNFNYTEEECQSMNSENNTDVLIDTQHLVNTFSIYEEIAQTLLPLIILLIAGPWSDRYGRKPLIYLTLIGYSFFTINALLVALFPKCPAQFLLIGEFMEGIGGGNMMFMMVVYSFVSDRTSSADRFYRMAIMSGIWHMGMPVGTMIGPVLFDAGGYNCVFVTSFLLHVLCILYIRFFTRDKQNKNSEISKYHCSGGTLKSWNAIETFRFAFTKKPAGGRWILLCLIGSMLLHVSSLMKNTYLWTQLVFGWTLDQFSLWYSIDSMYHQILVLVLSPVIAVIGFHDCTIGAFLVFMEFLSNLWKGCATRKDQWWFMYGTTVINLSPELVAVAQRSSISKVCPEDAGKAFSLVAIAQCIWLMIDRVIITKIYDATMETYKSTVALVDAGYSGCVMISFIMLRQALIKFEKKKRHIAQNEADKKSRGAD